MIKSMKAPFDFLLETISHPGAKARILICNDLNGLSLRAADFVEWLTPSTIVLSGGSTPKALYSLLSKRNIAWNNTHFFWGDERPVIPDHPESNYRMARESLLDHIRIPGNHVHRIAAELGPETAAVQYEAEIRTFFSSVPSFELVLLGLGEDGHTASLFPETEALHVQDRLVVANDVSKLNTKRITMTFPILNAANCILFLVSGESKALALKQIWKGEYDPLKFPAQAIYPANGELYFFVDREAACLVATPGTS
jgi:6-phosphogluconolactonase